ncbi:hypothetical protein COCMIDRAFT_22330 [Bipolaris oryzae ATCC 44560]|uniref:Uncharacterized protein n=1 Tax=Bipolaris oryzae ATCC 44560 TaxID=930090 RepID=W6ZJQ5_COCMI|nr:uncharacterized protein COCMIDRAFT_22330 [Bipolaris oryzae ATCC 44560]EUC50238.1 hypothetical protein COCMIDRAFT_22330 [Bipolaris oryzae ATCC 44560]
MGEPRYRHVGFSSLSLRSCSLRVRGVPLIFWAPSTPTLLAFAMLKSRRGEKPSIERIHLAPNLAGTAIGGRIPEDLGQMAQITLHVLFNVGWAVTNPPFGDKAGVQVAVLSIFCPARSLEMGLVGGPSYIGNAHNRLGKAKYRAQSKRCGYRYFLICAAEQIPRVDLEAHPPPTCFLTIESESCLVE